MSELVECVPNFSEGRNLSVVRAIAAEISSDRSVRLLDQEMNADHNRSVITFVGEAEAVVEAALKGVRKATELIDLRRHRGEHPRMGATDVLPFVPVGSTRLERCVELARIAGERIGAELKIPVFLYEAAAARPSRQNLADVRRGEFEGLAREIGANPERLPDFGPPHIHPSAGAIAVGARMPLLAFNVNLGTKDVEIAKKIAKAIRFQSGGLRHVKALGFALQERGIVQISMNLVNTWGTPVQRVFALIKDEADRYGVPIVGSEVVGLVSQDALIDVAEHYLRIENFSRDQILENRLARRIGATEQTVAEFLEDVASAAPTPGGGSVSALAGALGAALATMVARLTIGKQKYAEHETRMRDAEARAEALRRELFDLVREDARAYEGFRSASKQSRAHARRGGLTRAGARRRGAERDACAAAYRGGVRARARSGSRGRDLREPERGERRGGGLVARPERCGRSCVEREDQPERPAGGGAGRFPVADRPVRGAGRGASSGLRGTGGSEDQDGMRIGSSAIGNEG